MSTVILEVAEEQEQELFELLEKMPGVRVVNFSIEELAKHPWLMLQGKYKNSRVSSESLAAENEENKRLEGEAV